MAKSLIAVLAVSLVLVPLEVDLRPSGVEGEAWFGDVFTLSEAQCAMVADPDDDPWGPCEEPSIFFPCDECENAPWDFCDHTQAFEVFEHMRPY